MRGTAKKLQVCSVSIDWWPRYTVHEIVIKGAYRAELPEIALCPKPGYSTTAKKFKLRHYPNVLTLPHRGAIHRESKPPSLAKLGRSAPMTGTLLRAASEMTVPR
jgi:hypothetical protein